jgi:hypothetical protein
VASTAFSCKKVFGLLLIFKYFPAICAVPVAGILKDSSTPDYCCAEVKNVRTYLLNISLISEVAIILLIIYAGHFYFYLMQ